MSQEIPSSPPRNQQPEDGGEISRRTADRAKETTARDANGLIEGVTKEVTDATKGAVKRATATAQDVYQSATQKAEQTLTTSKDYVRQNPVRVVLGAVAFGAVIGCLLTMARRKPTFREHYAEEPLAAVREAILGAFAPVAQTVHKTYDSAREDAGKIRDRVHNLGSGRTGNSLSHQIGRIGNTLKFW